MILVYHPNHNNRQKINEHKKSGGVYHERAIISFKTVEEIKEFVGAACNCPFDIDVVSGRITIDAKSILGMLSVNWQEELCVIYEAQNEKFDTVVQKYAVG